MTSTKHTDIRTLGQLAILGLCISGLGFAVAAWTAPAREAAAAPPVGKLECLVPPPNANSLCILVRR